MPAQPHEISTPADFMDWELRQEARHEFSGGRVIAFAGGTIEHAAIAGAVLSDLRLHLRGGPCRTYGSDIMIATSHTRRYADVVVACDERDHMPATTVLHFPKLVIEVLSEATAAVDRGEKLDEYRSIDTCAEYVLIDSRKRWAESYRRDRGEWIASLPVSTGNLHLTSVDFRIDLDGLYRECGVS